MPDSLLDATEVQLTVAGRRFCILGRNWQKEYKKRWERKNQPKKKKTKTRQADLEEMREGLHVIHTAYSSRCPRGNTYRETPPSPHEPHCEYAHDHNCTKDYHQQTVNWLSIQTGHPEYPLPILLSPLTYHLGRKQDQGSRNKCDVNAERHLRDSSAASPLNVINPEHGE